MTIPRSTVGGINVLDLMEALKRVGASPRRLSVVAGVDVEALSAPDRRVPSAVMLRLLEEAERLTGDPLIGLHAGERAEPRGPLIYLVMSSQRLEDGLRRVARFSRAVLDTLQIGVDVERDRGIVTFDFGDPGLEASRHPAEYLVMAFVCSIRRIVGSALHVVGVEFCHEELGGGAEAARAFGCPVRFGQATNRLVLPRDELRALSIFYNPQVAEQIERWVARTLPAETLRDRVANVARELLIGGRRAQARAVAGRIGMSERSLQRGLEAEQTTFRAVRDSTVREIVEALLANRELKLEAVALSAGFADGPALAKAVKRWAGCSPARYRERILSAAASAESAGRPRKR